MPFFAQAQSTSVSQSTFNNIGRDQINNFVQLSHLDEFKRYCRRGGAGAAFSSLVRPAARKNLQPSTVFLTDVKQKIRLWFDGEHEAPLFWLKGSGSSGKLAIAESIREDYAGSGELAASFFFNQEESDEPLAHNLQSVNFIPTIVYLLSIHVPQTKALMERAFERNPFITDQNTAHQFEKLVVEPLLELRESVSRMIVIIDSLDQRTGERWVDDLVLLCIDACRDNRLPLRFCLTSQMDLSALLLEAVNRPGRSPHPLMLEGFDVPNNLPTFNHKLKIAHLDLDQHVTRSSHSSKSASELIVRLLPQSISSSPEHHPVVSSAHQQEPLVDADVSTREVSRQAGHAPRLSMLQNATNPDMRHATIHFIAGDYYGGPATRTSPQTVDGQPQRPLEPAVLQPIEADHRQYWDYLFHSVPIRIFCTILLIYIVAISILNICGNRHPPPVLTS